MVLARTISTSEPISETVARRLERSGRAFGAGDNIADQLETGELAAIEAEVASRCRELLRSLVIDLDRDPHSKATPERLAKMFVRELFAGRFAERPDLTSFATGNEDALPLVIGPLPVRSVCAHHWQPIRGKAWIAVQPGATLPGLSKYQRLLEWLAARGQVQEELTRSLARELVRGSMVKGAHVSIRAAHACMSQRGVKTQGTAVWTSAVAGSFDPSSPDYDRARAERAAALLDRVSAS
jgi:GTP cyclohydrolase IA